MIESTFHHFLSFHPIIFGAKGLKINRVKPLFSVWKYPILDANRILENRGEFLITLPLIKSDRMTILRSKE